jgi:L-iditol 2-dehydrogenase
MMKKGMKAALFYGDKKDIRIEEIDRPVVERGDVLLKVNSCGICGSDARTYFNGIEKRYKIPIIFGHELTATIHELGPETTRFKTGDRVVVAPIYGCGQCEFCVSSKENLCKDVVVFGCTFDGGFAEYMRIPEKGIERGTLVKIDDTITDHEGTMIEPLSCCLHGLRQLNIQPGDSVAVFGSGPIGLCHMMLSKRLGAGKVCMLDLVETRLEEAEAFGADYTIDTGKNNWENMLYNIFGENGVDVAVTAAPSIAAIKSAVGIVKQGGKLLVFGGLPHGSVWNLDPNIIHYREITVYGSIDSTIDDFRRTVSIAPQLPLNKFITHTFRLEEVKKGMEVMMKKKGLKVILDLTK